MFRILFAALFLFVAPAWAEDKNFTIAVIPDTQNYLDYLHQRAEDFPFDAADQFHEQMSFIAANTRARGGDIVFVTSVGDVWQHATLPIDPVHAAMGLKAHKVDLPRRYQPSDKVYSVEMPAAKRGYDLLHGLVPFSVAPGNHDYDAAWLDANTPFNFERRRGQLHYGGLNNFRQIFGSDTDYFKDADFYIDSFNGGANSVTRFDAGGYKFLHIAIEMQPADDVLAWMERVLITHKGLPTIVSVHEYLNARGERKASASLNLSAVHADHNTPEDLWQKIIRRHDQIFLVLSGHFHGSNRRIDDNAYGHKVYQLLADYQDRRKTFLDAIAGTERKDDNSKIGDGWMRLMRFDFSGEVPLIIVRTYSTHYKQYASEFVGYTKTYREGEQPRMTNAEFLAHDEFVLTLNDFKKRFKH